MKQHPFDRPLVRAEFTVPDGEVLTRDWSVRDIEANGRPTLAEDGPPAWLRNPSKAWPHPQDPITFRGTVMPGYEQDARGVLGADLQGESDGG